jgi:hypothetical protein
VTHERAGIGTDKLFHRRRCDHKDREVALVLEVLGHVDGRHHAFAKLALDLLVAGEGRVEAGGVVGVGPVSCWRRGAP